MRHEKIIRRDDGSRVVIKVNLIVDYSLKNTVSIDVGVCQKRKRTFLFVGGLDRWQRRDMTSEEIANYKLEQQLEVVTRDEIDEAIVETVNKVLPFDVQKKVNEESK